MEGSPEELVELAVGRGLAFLSARDRTVSEMRAQLKKRGFSEDIGGRAIARLADMGYLDDVRFSHRFIEDRRVLDGWGNSRIERRLLELGVSRETIEGLLDRDKDELEVVRAVEVLKRRLSGPADAASDRRRALGLLMRKGYSLETASDAVREHSKMHA